jgi:hypothetical protein
MDPPDVDFVNPRTVNEGIQIEMKQVWKRKYDGLLVRVSGLIFVEPKRVIWEALPNQNNPSASGITNEPEYKQQYEYQQEKRDGPRWPA